MNLRFFRQERGLTQIELSQATGIPRYIIQLIEQGIVEANEEEAARIAEALGLAQYTGGKWAFKII